MTILKSQIAKMEAFVEMDEPESLLDAMHKLCNAQPSDPSGQMLDPNAWRARVHVRCDCVYRCLLQRTDDISRGKWRSS